MSEKKTKTIYWVLKILSVVISCAFPIFAICEKFPVWTITHGAGRTVGTGGILILIVVVVIFRKSVLNFMRDRMKLQYAPPLVIWLVMIIVGYVLMFINSFIQDLTTIFCMGFIGCAIGTLITYIAESKFGNTEDENNDGT